jgi:CDP-4-dehydro-6-deoxyglucose reductase
MLPDWQTGLVKRIEQATSNTRRYWIELAKPFAFKPGQFVTLDLPIHEKRNRRWRSYSIASMPDESNVIELIIVYVEGGVASKYIFDKINEGDSFTLRGPHGLFVLPEKIEKDLYFICTGTGIAPFRSMLHYINQHQVHHRKITLLFGTRTREDLLYADEMRDLERMMPAFSYRPTLSREEWEGDTGYVHAIYEELCVNRAPSAFYLCGWRAMTDEAKERILKMGYDKKDIHVEVYG